MTPTEKEQLQAMYARYNYQCYVCGKQATQRAHIISNTKKNRRIYGKGVIDSPLNWLPACSLACNALIDASNNLRLKEMISFTVSTQVLDDWHYSRVARDVTKNIKRKKDKLYKIDNVCYDK